MEGASHVHASMSGNAMLSVTQADIDSAFRRIPIRPDHRMYANVVFKCNDQTLVAQHLSVMFGSVASVHHWERVGTHILSLSQQLQFRLNFHAQVNW